MKSAKSEDKDIVVDQGMKKVKCWEIFHCDKKECPVLKSKTENCWLVSGTLCRDSIQGKFLEKMEMCLSCEAFQKNQDLTTLKDTLETVNKQFTEFRNIIHDRDSELELMSMELAISLSVVFEALKRISSGDPAVRVPEDSPIELISRLNHLVNMTAAEIGEIVDQSHEFAIVLAEHFDVLHRVSKGKLDARVTGKSQVELLECLKKVTNEMIESIQREIKRREQAEKELKQSYDELEDKINKRTEALRVINEKLWQEVTERKRVEDNLREAELRYQTIADFTFAWEYWETPDGRLIYVSPSSERVSGYKAEHFIQNQQFLSEIILPEDREIWAQHHHDAYDDLRPRDIMFRIRSKDGSVRWIEHICQPVMDNQGNFLGIRASNRDITLRKETEEKLRDTLSLLSATIESTADGILVVDMKGKIVIYNHKFLEMWHVPLSVIDTRDDNKILSFVLDQLKDAEEFAKRVRELYDNPESVSFDVLEFKDGRVYERYSHPQKIGDLIIGRVWSFRDVTERKKSERTLRESEQLLLQAHKMEAIGRLAAGVAHEINNPLAVINEKAGLMKDFLELSGDFQKYREKFISLIQGIFESVGRCRTITHRLLGFSRRVDASLETFDLNNIVREVIDFVEKEILYKNVQLKITYADNLSHVESDKGQIQQVILNILNNAVDAVDKGGFIEVQTGIKDERTVTVSIIDNGHGIPENIRNHIFEPFFTTKEKDKGTGLGLSISYGIMKKLGGTITVKSKVNEGTTFVIEIPTRAKSS